MTRSLEKFLNFNEENQNREEIQEIINLLEKNSVVEYKEENDCLNIHRRTQDLSHFKIPINLKILILKRK